MWLQRDRCDGLPAGVPRGAGKYPLYILAEVQDGLYDGEPLTLEVELTKSSAKSPWLVANAGGFAGGNTLFEGRTSGGNLNDPPHVPLPLQQGPTEMTSYFDRIDSTGVVPSLPADWQSNPMLEQDAAQSANALRLTVSQYIHQRVTHTITEESPPIGVGDGAVIFATVAEHETVTADGNHVITQDQSETAWGAGLPPGNYHQVVLDSIDDLCISETSEGVFHLLAYTGGTYEVQATKATTS